MTWPPTRAGLIPDYPEECDLTPKEVLLLLVDLNERYHGAFERVCDELDLAIDLLRDCYPGSS